MGSQKRRSSDRLQIRASMPPMERETLLPCPACGGDGKQLTETVGTYRMAPCRWCDGKGAVEAKLIAMFRRWLRIKHVNRKAGRCSDK